MNFVLIFISLISPFLVAASPHNRIVASVETPVVSCVVNAKNKKLISVSSLKVNIELLDVVHSGTPECQAVKWKNSRFLQVRYNRQEPTPHTNKKRIVSYVEIYKLDKKPELMIENPVGELKTVWMETNNHLLMRLQDKMENGKPIFANGYILDPKSNEFTDYKVFARHQGWKYSDF